MGLQQLQFRPGVNREGTTLSNEGGWYDCDKIRFRSGYPQKIGGWTAVSFNTFLGICRALWCWVTNNGFTLTGVGTNLKYYLESGGSYYDITPIRFSSTGAVTFSATVGSPIVRVTDLGCNAQADDFVTYANAVSLGGAITATVLNSQFQIVSVLSSSVYTINVGVNATAGDVGNGNQPSTTARYQLYTGPETYTTVTGWGAGGWSGFDPSVPASGLVSSINSIVTSITVVSAAGFPSSGTILIDQEIISYTGIAGSSFTGCVRGVNGTLASAHSAGALAYSANSFTGWGLSAGTSIGRQLRLWAQSNYGEYLIFNYRVGPLCMWVPTTAAFPALNTRGVILSPTSSGIYQTDADCPTVCNISMVSYAARIVIAFGCNDYGSSILNPLLIRWSAVEDYTTWTPDLATNEAGSFPLTLGSIIVGALQTRQEILVWTDAAIYSMQYSGPPYTWSIVPLADNISIIGPNAATTVNGVTYWMGIDKFYIYSGRVETLPCSLRQFVYDDINKEQGYQVFAGTNEGYSEVWWYYCSANSTVVDRYVIYNYLDKVWYYGTLNRSYWLDSPIRTYPLAATYNRVLVNHEQGNDDNETSTPTPISAYIQSSDFDIGDGHNYGFVWRVIPDITFNGSTSEFPSVNFTVRPRQNPGADYGVADSPTVTANQPYNIVHSYNVQKFTQLVYTRVRGRQLAFKVESNTLGTQWQLGTPRLDVRPDGRR